MENSRFSTFTQSKKKMVEYIKDDLVIVWKPELCRHAGICVKSLPAVFRPIQRPWVRPEMASKDELINLISKCPTGALSYRIGVAKHEETTLVAERGI